MVMKSITYRTGIGQSDREDYNIEYGVYYMGNDNKTYFLAYDPCSRESILCIREQGVGISLLVLQRYEDNQNDVIGLPMLIRRCRSLGIGDKIKHSLVDE